MYVQTFGILHKIFRRITTTYRQTHEATTRRFVHSFRYMYVGTRRACISKTYYDNKSCWGYVVFNFATALLVLSTSLLIQTYAQTFVHTYNHVYLARYLCTNIVCVSESGVVTISCLFFCVDLASFLFIYYLFIFICFVFGQFFLFCPFVYVLFLGCEHFEFQFLLPTTMFMW